MKTKLRYFKTPFIVAIPLTPILGCFETYIFGDWEYLKFLLILVAIDSLLGVWKHIILKTCSSKGYGQVAKKLVLYGIVLIIGNSLASFPIKGESVDSLRWIEYFFCTMLMIREAISCIENIGVIYPGLIPSFVLERLKEFPDNRADIKKLKNK